MSFATLLIPLFGLCQTPAIDAGIRVKLDTLKYLSSLYDPASGGYRWDANSKVAGLRATSGVIRAWGFLSGDTLGAKPPHDPAKLRAFILGCYDPATGAFAEPGGKPDVTITSVGVIAAVAAGVPKEQFRKAMDYLQANAKTFDDVRIGAAAVEAWGVADCPFDLAPWHAVGAVQGKEVSPPPPAGGARNVASLAAFTLRLGKPLTPGHTIPDILARGQLRDGGWGVNGIASDPDSTYRVMRTYHLMKTPPADPDKVRAYVASHRNPDGGYGLTPGAASSASGTYYAAAILMWLDAEARK